MNSKVLLIAFLLLGTFFWACSPKTAQTTKTNTPPVTETKPETPKEDPLSPCKNWKNAPNKDVIIEAHVLYKDRLREIRDEKKKGAAMDKKKIQQLYTEAFDLWEEAYTAAPAADGKRADHFEDGIKFYNYRYENARDQAAKKEAVDNIMRLHDERSECYGEKGYIMGRKGFDYYYKYPEFATDMEKYEMLKKSIDMDGKEANYFILNPLTGLLANLVVAEKIPVAEAQEYQKKIMATLNHGLANCKTARECEPWKIIESYAPARLEQLEGIKGFYDCAYYTEKYYKEFEADSKNCEVIDEVLSRFRWGGCTESNSQFATLLEADRTHCYVAPPTAGDLKQARDALNRADYKEAIGHYENYIAKTDDTDKKAKFTLRIAKIYYVHLKSFSKARSYARKAAKLKSNWGEPYLLIGRLYASSGPLCGPGRGWDSQIVTWPAIDQWNKAKRVDPSVAAEANKFIRQYEQYMPEFGEIFQRSLKEGDSFTVPCWIQEKTIIRAKK